MSDIADQIELRERDGGVEFGVKVVPGSSRDAVVGVLSVAGKTCAVRNANKVMVGGLYSRLHPAADKHFIDFLGDCWP